MCDCFHGLVFYRLFIFHPEQQRAASLAVSDVSRQLKSR